MNTYQITQITYSGSSQRHTEKWIVKSRRAPTPNEVRARLSISPREGTILVAKIDFPVWELPLPLADEEEVPAILYNEIRRYLGKHPYYEPGDPSYLNTYFLKLLKKKYGAEAVLRVIEELT